jgi:hypothetical protein
LKENFENYKGKQIMKNPLVVTTVLAMVMITSTSARLQADTVTDITSPNGQGFSASNYSAITTSNTNPDPRPNIYALGYVHANCLPGKVWDLEAFAYDGTANSLVYVGGFNPLTQIQADNLPWSLGDIFISPGAVTNPSPTITDGHPVDYSNPGYTYAIHFTRPASGTTLAYTIYDLTGSTQIQSVYFNQNTNAGPYALDLNALGGATIVGGGTSVVQTDTGAAVNTLLGETLFNTVADQASNDNYVVSIPLGSLTALGLTVFDASLTESCGNDSLQGSGTAINLVVPEPGSLGYALAGAFFLCGSGLLRRKLQA